MSVSSFRSDKNPLTLSVNLKGQVFLNDSEIAVDELVPKLKAITEARGGLDERIFVQIGQEPADAVGQSEGPGLPQRQRNRGRRTGAEAEGDYGGARRAG